MEKMTTETKLNHNENSKNQISTEVSRFRRIIPQIIATTVVNLLTIDAGLIFALPGVVIAALTGILNEHNQNEFLRITPLEASWMGSIGYLVQPFGSLISTLVTDPLGRKRSMILVNIPFAIGWYMLYRATQVWEVFFGFSVLGMAIGLREAAVLTYLGEICEPSTRGILNAYSNVCETLGMLVIYVLNTLLPWRTVCGVCLSFPIVSMVMLCFVPETPQWLLSRNRPKQAEQSLSWLRGWVPNQLISQEFSELHRHSERSKSCELCIKQDVKCTHPLPTMGERFSEVKRKRTMKPFIIIISLSFLSQFSGVNAMRPFIVQIFKAYNSPIPPDQATAILSVIDNLGIVAFMCLVCYTGKRRLYLVMASGIFVTSFATACYGFMYLPAGTISFDQTENVIQSGDTSLSFIPMICLYLWSFFSYCGVIAMPWVLLAELFSFKSRGIMVGISAAMSYAFGFIGKKIYYNLETTLSLPGVTLFFSCVCGIGLIWMYLILPETENKSLEDIELHFSDNSKKMTNHKIAKVTNPDRIKESKDEELSILKNSDQQNH